MAIDNLIVLAILSLVIDYILFYDKNRFWFHMCLFAIALMTLYIEQTFMGFGSLIVIMTSVSLVYDITAKVTNNAA